VENMHEKNGLGPHVRHLTNRENANTEDCENIYQMHVCGYQQGVITPLVVVKGGEVALTRRIMTQTLGCALCRRRHGHLSLLV